MRLALIGPVYPYRGGIAHYTTGLYKALQKRWHEVLLISFRRQYPQWLFPGQSDKDPSQEPLRVEQAHYWIDSLNPCTWLATFRRIYAYHPDLILLQWWVTLGAPAWFVLGTLNRWLLKRPMLIICHNVLPHETRLWDRWLARLTLRQGTEFIAQFAEEQDQLLNLVPGAKVQIFPLPIFDMLAAQQVSRDQARRQLGLSEDVPALLFFGIVREYKGLSDLLEALPAVKENLGQVLLIVAGEFWDDKQPYLDAIQQLGIEDSVLVDDRYIPNEEVAAYFSAADALVAPYRHVTGSAVIPTARAFRLPVVTTDLPGIGPAVDRRVRFATNTDCCSVHREFVDFVLITEPDTAWLARTASPRKKLLLHETSATDSNSKHGAWMGNWYKQGGGTVKSGLTYLPYPVLMILLFS